MLFRSKKGVRKALLEWGKLPVPFLKHSSEDFVCPLVSSFTSSLSRLSRRLSWQRNTFRRGSSTNTTYTSRHHRFRKI